MGGVLQAGELSFEVIPSSQILNVGDTLTITMRITVYGMPEKFDAEPLSKLELPGFKTISTSPTHRRGKEGEDEFEERITIFRLVAEEAGVQTIPQFEIPYYSDLDEYHGSLTSQELQITVNPAPKSAMESGGIYIIGIFLLVVLISVVGFLIWFRRIKSKQFKAEENQNIQAKFAKWADDLQALLSNGKKDTFTEQAFNYVNEFIEDNYRLGLKGKKFEKRMTLINEKRVHLRLVELFKMAHVYLDELKFGGILRESEELSELLNELKTIDQYIEKSSLQ
jgi:hypothetical protein